MGKLKATKRKNVEGRVATVEAIAPKGGSKMDFLEITKDGKSKFRIFPAHPESKTGSYKEPVCRAFMEMEYEDKDGKAKVGKKPIFSAQYHAEEPDNLCPIQEYVRIARGIAYKEHPTDKDERYSFLNDITGFGKGFAPSLQWEMYAIDLKSGARGILKLSDSLSKKVDGLAEDISEDDDQYLEIDPFTDPEGGYTITITHDSDAPPATRYRVSQSLAKGELSDDDESWLLKQKSMDSRYTGVYCQEDYDMAIEALERFEDGNSDWEILDSDEFQEIVSKCEDIEWPNRVYGEDHPKADKSDSKNEKPEKPKKKKKDEPVEDDELDGAMNEGEDLPLEDMDRKQLVAYVKSEGLDLNVKASWDEKKIIKKIRKVEAEDEPEAPTSSDDDEFGDLDD